MKFSVFKQAYSKNVIELFTKVFSVSEGEFEGRVIGNLVAGLITTSNSQDLFGYVATSNSQIMGCIFFSRFIVPNNQIAFILSPVAISTDVQGTGIGQQLINYGIDQLKGLNVNLLFTYGDPNFYCKTGFKQISESIVKAPFTLSQPEGWLAQSLDDRELKSMSGETKCVEALSDPKYW